jgi:hypothetical protein
MVFPAYNSIKYLPSFGFSIGVISMVFILDHEPKQGSSSHLDSNLILRDLTCYIISLV